MHLGDIIFQIIVFGFVFLLLTAFTLFVKSLVRNQNEKIQHNNELEKKLDKVTSLLEEKESKN
ncbi:DUF4083 domain-containing protein [Bacillus sp. RG28]|uniref:DUF4083 domain-containing protein n=1 Tax=Gottfriedia endophytica TaxID=2820819 RepID=A0A940NVK0_9BACI|nr:DUF4083 domain-containing protein [Gottfriedia endophytica]MBP0725713.1 DUF4083 domain-containing protein [Gottfriedia endophytica]